MTSACSIRVRGVVQGVGLRPFVYRLAHENALAGWVLNAGEGVEIHVEGTHDRLHTFVRELSAQAPPAAVIAAIDVVPASPSGLREFTIRDSRRLGGPTAAISPDLAICQRCLVELFDTGDPRHGYPYITCTNCGPRYSIVTALPYDRPATTMAAWPMDDRCADEYHDPTSRRFHAQPIACPTCGPGYELRTDEAVICGSGPAVTRAVALLGSGSIVAVKGIGGFHLACDAHNAAAVASLRERKYRKEKPFAVMARDLAAARRSATLSASDETLLESPARPIVLAQARETLAGVSPDNDELGLVLPYTPLHHLLFAAGAPELLVMTSANRSNEPIAYEDAVAMERLSGLADAVLIGQRPIARRVEDSVVRSSPGGPVMLRRGRGYAPSAVATLPVEGPLLALGADLKNAITLVVDGQAFVSQHIGDLEHYDAFRAFGETIDDLLRMYDVRRGDLRVVRDAHPQYRSSAYAPTIEAGAVIAVQHHRAHVASVLAERGDLETRVLGIALDGTGYGDDGTIWGTEVFVGSVATGFERVAHLRTADLAGGDAAARHPVQAAAGFLSQVSGLPDLEDAPFRFPTRYREAVRLLEARTRTFVTSSAGRLFDTAAALLGFTRPVSFEGQAAIWLEQLARRSSAAVEPYAFPFDGRELDYRPLLRAVLDDRLGGRDASQIARAFQAGLARGLVAAIVRLTATHAVTSVVASGGVLQNELLRRDLESLLATESLALWINHSVPANDGGISLGQAALAAFHHQPVRA